MRIVIEREQRREEMELKFNLEDKDMGLVALAFIVGILVGVVLF